MLQIGGLSAMGLGLTACSIPSSRKSESGASMWGQQRAIEAFWAQHTKPAGTLNFTNWPLYIDILDDKHQNVHPTLEQFTKKYGIKVNYSEDINENDTYYAKIAPLLRAGQSTGADLMVITNGIYLDKLIQNDYLLPLDQNRMSNFYAQASDLVRDPSFDRGNVFSMAWQSGITGIGYNPKLTGREITSWQDLQDPAFKGKIGMFGDNEDLPGSALCAIGVNPETSVEKDWHAAADWLKKQQPLVRKYYQQDYISPLKKGDLAVTMAWSGDIFQALSDNPDLKFVVPKEGAMIWTDNMCMPRYADHPLDAMIYMDYVYDPQVAAALADYINYITPVPAVQQIFAQNAKNATNADDKTYYAGLATSPLIFPSASDFSKLHRYRVLSETELPVWNQIFEPIYQA
jgi:spermidine/putrescine transport system substrate-binding protein